MKILRIFILLIFVSCGDREVEIRNVYHPVVEKQEKIAWFHCKSTSTTSIQYCTVPGFATIRDIIEIQAMDDKECVEETQVGIFSEDQFWVKSLCNAWIKFTVGV